MWKTLPILLVVWTVAYSSNQAPDKSPSGEAVVPDKNAAVMISMEGEDHQLEVVNMGLDSAIFEANEIRFLLAEEGNPVSLNFNLTGTNILETGSAVYEIPDANHGGEMIDLNFFNKDRDSKRMQKRIIFKAGTIEIQQLTRNSLRMSFNGIGKPLTGKEEFPVEGSVDVTF